MPRRPQKRTAERRRQRPQSSIAIDPLVGPGNPPHRHPPRAKTDQPRSRHCMVHLATRTSSHRSKSPCQAKYATVMLEHGNGNGSCLAYAWLGSILGMYFGDYRAGFRFGRLGLDLAEKAGLDRVRARVCLVFAVHVANWTQHLSFGRGLLRRAFAAAQEAGDLPHVAYSCVDLVTNFLASGDPLGEAQQEAENGLEFVGKMSCGLISDCMTGQLRLIRVLRGLTPTLTAR